MSDQSDRSDQEAAPACPLCGKPMCRRTAKQGRHAGQAFWGCTAYPACRSTCPAEEDRTAGDATP